MTDNNPKTGIFGPSDTLVREEQVIAMARALRGCDALHDENKRAAAYIAADVCCDDWHRYDERATAYEAVRRNLVAAGLLNHES